MGLLDNNSVFTTPKTGLETTHFKHVFSNPVCDVFTWDVATLKTSLKLTFRDGYAWVKNDGSELYLLQGEITGTPTTIEVNATNFPNLRQNGLGNYPAIVRVIACPCSFFMNWETYAAGKSNLTGTDYRICVIFDNGQIYHNWPSCHDTYDFTRNEQYYNGLFYKFDESVVWDLPNRKHPVKTKTGTDATLIATGAYYYNPSLPDNCYEFHPGINQANGYGNTLGFAATNSVNVASRGEDIGTRSRFFMTDRDNVDSNSFDYMGGYVAKEMCTMIATYRENEATACRICVFGTQDGGRNWYCMYEFAGRDRMKEGEGVYSGPQGVVGLAMSQNGGSAGSGLYKIRRRALIIPNETDKEPANLFEYDGDVNVDSIVGSSTAITVTTASAHGFQRGDVILFGFQTGVSDSGRDFDWLINETADADSGGNGIMFKIQDVTSTTFTLSLYVYNPGNNLPVRHIHSLNACRDGVVVGTGETYPYGGWILFNKIAAADSWDNYNIANTSTAVNPFIRLNSTKTSAQRPVGCLVRQENDGTYVYFASDETTIETQDVEMPAGRTETFSHNTTGVYKIKLSDIDDFDNAKLVYPSDDVAYGLVDYGGIFVFIGQNGDVALSADEGKTWTFVPIPDDAVVKYFFAQQCCHFSGLAEFKYMSIDNILIKLNK